MTKREKNMWDYIFVESCDNGKTIEEASNLANQAVAKMRQAPKEIKEEHSRLKNRKKAFRK